MRELSRARGRVRACGRARGRVRAFVRAVVALTAAALVAGLVAASPAAADHGNDLDHDGGNGSGKPTISGTQRAGSTLTAGPGTLNDPDGFTGVTFTYVWYRTLEGYPVFVPVARGEANTYKLTVADVGEKLRVRITYTDEEGNRDASDYSDFTGYIGKDPSNSAATGTPAIVLLDSLGTGLASHGFPSEVYIRKGTQNAGVPLISDSDGLTYAYANEEEEFAYQWYRVKAHCVPNPNPALPPTCSETGPDLAIPGATNSVYTPVVADVGYFMAATVSFTDDKGNPESRRTVTTVPITLANNFPAGGRVAVSGIERVGEVLTAPVSGIFDGNGLDGAVFSFQWLRVGSDKPRDGHRRGRLAHLPPHRRRRGPAGPLPGELQRRLRLRRGPAQRADACHRRGRFRFRAGGGSGQEHGPGHRRHAAERRLY